MFHVINPFWTIQVCITPQPNLIDTAAVKYHILIKKNAGVSKIASCPSAELNFTVSLSERKVKRARWNSNSLLPNHPPASWMCFTWLTHFEQYFVQLLTHINNHIFLLRTCEPVCIAVSVNERDYGQGMNIFIWYVFIVSEREQVKKRVQRSFKKQVDACFLILI